ncbi:transposable element Tcb1 transposase [Trichonephila clavipes]|nr:transposable element Tcb1 transposase [Trichonephila clavipes]
MGQRKHLDDFLRGRCIGRLHCGRTELKESEELGIAQSVISRHWQRFQDAGNIWITHKTIIAVADEDIYLYSSSVNVNSEKHPADFWNQYNIVTKQQAGYLPLHYPYTAFDKYSERLHMSQPHSLFMKAIFTDVKP